MIKYIGSKRTLLPAIGAVVQRLAGDRLIDPSRPVVDAFSGTARVAHALKAQGFAVWANDHNAYAETLARCYVEADADTHGPAADKLIAEFNRLPGQAGYVTETFCTKARYFQPFNGERIDAIREAIEAKGLDPVLKAVVLVSLMEAADRVDSTTGVQMAYLKQWAARSYNPLELRLPALFPRAKAGPGKATELDAADALKAAVEDGATLAYLDPPYNQHSYLGNYHIWETLVRWDHPEAYGVAQKRVDVRTRKSAFNTKAGIGPAFTALLDAVDGPLQAPGLDAVIVSFSDEGFLPRATLEGGLRGLWGGTAHVTTLSHDYKRYVGAQIGIYNPQGEKVGRVSHLRNTEFLFIATRRPFAP